MSCYVVIIILIMMIVMIQGQGLGPGAKARRFLLGPGLGPWPLQCMHKSVVHAQECFICTRISYMHKNLDICNVVAM